jgi:hypothetical protein
MRRRWAIGVGIAVLAILFTGCIGSTGDGIEDASTEAPSANATNASEALPATITGLEETTSVSTEGGGNGIWVDEQRDLLLSSNGGGGLQLVDIGNETPEKLGTLGEVTARDVDLLRWDGTPYAVLAAGSAGIHVVDVSDPRAPEKVATADEYGSHNLAAVQGTPYVYDSTAVGPSGKAQGAFVPVLDLSTPEDPSWTTFSIPAQVNGRPTQSDGCHDVWVQEELDRAYCAGGGSAGMTYGHGGGETFIWNISEDPTDPEWVGLADHPSIMYHHQAVPSENGNHLYINDEFLAPNCRSMQPVESGPAVKQSTAAMWVFDISDPANPEMRSYVQNPEDTPHANCGSHFGDRIEDRNVLAWGWYGGGTMLIDVEDPANPEILDEVAADESTWDARYHDGRVYSSSASVQVLDILGE